MPLTVGDRAVRPLTADEVMRMAELGILRDDERVELVDGLLTEKPVKSPAHATLQARLLRWLGPVMNQYDARTDAPLVVPDRTYLPEPDLAVVPSGGDLRAHPHSALLVIEVAVSSLGTDTTTKAALYAAAGVPEYWVVDVPGRRLHCLAGPQAGGYAVERIEVPPATVGPDSLAVCPLDLAELFAGLS